MTPVVWQKRKSPRRPKARVVLRAKARRPGSARDPKWEASVRYQKSSARRTGARSRREVPGRAERRSRERAWSQRRYRARNPRTYCGSSKCGPGWTAQRCFAVLQPEREGCLSHPPLGWRRTGSSGPLRLLLIWRSPRPSLAWAPCVRKPQYRKSPRGWVPVAGCSGTSRISSGPPLGVGRARRVMLWVPCSHRPPQAPPCPACRRRPREPQAAWSRPDRCPPWRSRQDPWACQG
mmetsp:Transcript_19634/g.55227  ORF Transcript_19634/g.55227 Transcript_19634/m.55227 type:complete len:235 (-) Transcript_19634:330-1034(-)